jgi:hypothetical protein
MKRAKRKARTQPTRARRTRSDHVESWTRRKHVSIGSVFGPKWGNPKKEPRGEFVAVVEHNAIEKSFLSAEVDLRIEGPPIDDTGHPSTLMEWTVHCWGSDLYAIRDALTAAIKQAERDSASTRKAKAYTK